MHTKVEEGKKQQTMLDKCVKRRLALKLSRRKPSVGDAFPDGFDAYPAGSRSTARTES